MDLVPLKGRILERPIGKDETFQSHSLRSASPFLETLERATTDATHAVGASLLEQAAAPLAGRSRSLSKEPILGRSAGKKETPFTIALAQIREFDAPRTGCPCGARSDGDSTTHCANARSVSSTQRFPRRLPRQRHQRGLFLTFRPEVPVAGSTISSTSVAFPLRAIVAKVPAPAKPRRATRAHLGDSHRDRRPQAAAAR
jgi:hypothetical protein